MDEFSKNSSESLPEKLNFRKSSEGEKAFGRNFETNRDRSSFETLPLLIFINSSDNDLDET